MRYPGMGIFCYFCSRMEKIYKFSGAGNDFVVLDGREADVSAYRQP